jgi:hypothetical protein
MRKIEQQMVEAIRSGDNWKSGNTEVRHSIVSGVKQADIYLHGHHIADCWAEVWDTFPHATPNARTFRDWPTATTRSRLRALGVDASIKNFQACIDGKELGFRTL